MTDTTTPAVTPEPQAGDGQQTEQEQPNSEHAPLSPEQWRAEAEAARKEAAKYRTQLRAQEKATADAEAKRLAEQGEYKALYESVKAKAEAADTLQERYDALIAQVQAANEKRIAAIPEQMRSLVPEYDDPQRLAAWLEANAAVFAKPAAPSLDGRAGGNGTASAAVTDEEIEQLAARWRVKPEHIDRAAAAKMLRGK